MNVVDELARIANALERIADALEDEKKETPLHLLPDPPEAA